MLVRVGSMAAGNFGDYKPIAEDVWELRIDWGRGTACITHKRVNKADQGSANAGF